MVNVDVCTQSEPFELKIPLIFSGTVGFPRQRDGRYRLFFVDHRDINEKDDFVQLGQRRNLVRIGAPQSLFRIRRDYALLDFSANERYGMYNTSYF